VATTSTDVPRSSYRICADVSDRQVITRLASGLTRLDVLINCAGIVLPDPPCNHLTPLPELQAALLASPSSTWSDTFAVNVESPFFLSVSVMHLLAASPTHGRIINISSIGSTMSDPATHQPAYQASKAALNHLTRLLASKFRETGIRVNAISPGYFPSQMNDPTNPKSMLARAKELVPLKRGGEEEDAAGTAIWLASRAGSYVHGEVIPLAGGRNWA
jgi:NAD(P)-dependent dehydrogenase (short-subunit alcohol dehydrogenase family)